MKAIPAAPKVKNPNNETYSLRVDVPIVTYRGTGPLTKETLREAVVEGALLRLRPKIMTVCAILFGLLPIMWSQGAGADVMKRIAAPMVGGLFTSFILELLVYPAVYAIWKWNFEMKKGTVIPKLPTGPITAH